jgi:hypothetical protein
MHDFLRAYILCLVWLALWVVVMPGCAFEPEHAVPFPPPAEYRAIWGSAKDCTGRRGDFDRLRFYVVPETFKFDDAEAVGYTNGRDIYLTDEYRDHPMVVKHEMIHALGYSGHPPVFETCRATWASWEGK